MKLFRWRGLAAPAEDHPEPLRQLPVMDCPPPPGPWSTWTYQHGVHDTALDPTGAGPVNAEDAATRRNA